MIYRYRDGYRSSVKPQVAGERLMQLKEENGGHLTPDYVVDDARPEDAPLHPHFTWDDAVAGEKCRREEARSLIRAVRPVHVSADGKERKILGYINVDLEDVGRCYVSTDRMAYDAGLREQCEAEALKALQAWRDRYAHIQALSEIIQAIDQELARKAPRMAKNRRPMVAQARA